jgi:hypothetical protein
MYKLKMTTQNIKEELNKNMENLRKRIKQKSWKQNFPVVKQTKTQWKATPAD